MENDKASAVSLSATLSVGERVAQALANAGQALLAAANAIRGQPDAGFCPVGSPSLTLAPGMTLTELVNEFLRAKARTGRSDRYLRQLRVSLKSFAAGRARRVIDQVATTDLEKWIFDQDWAPKTARGYLADVKTMFAFAVRRGYLARNPAGGVELPVLEAGAAIQVHTPEQVRQLMDLARKADLDVCRHLAIRYFAGLRSAETFRLREGDLKLDQDLIEVPAVKSKTRARRLVTVQPNLRAWLALGGELRPMGDKAVRAVIKRSQVPWAHNVARHSFVSYHLAHFNNAGKTALEAGHSEQMLFRHYRALVAPASAAEYWQILPTGGSPGQPAPASAGR